MRHSKAENSHPGGDHARGLTGKGRTGARAAGEMLLDRGFRPDLIVSSTAARALQTAQIVAETVEPQAEFEQVPELYLSSAERLLTEIRGLPAGHSTVLLIAHNPGMVNLVNAFLSDGNHRDLPTAGFAVIQQQTDDWAEFGPGSATVIL